MLPIFFATYAAVFMAEIVGDKLLYTTGLLATRYKTLPILCGMAMAFMLKMAVAVLIGHLIASLPKWLVASITAINFFAIAVVLWRKKDTREVTEKNYKAYRAAMVAFAAIFFSEWGDVGQITAATMAARFNSPLAVWLGAVAAMVTKGTLASFVGGGVRGWIQGHFTPKTLRYAATVLLLVLGAASVWEILEPDTPGMLFCLFR
ncbi:MAG TPA: TMEM165/GDT1 family protein [Bryobacteraceae bacterium]|nr:TMEM165/GDT1 family protein [Bryobacteraceae bacterium]